MGAVHEVKAAEWLLRTIPDIAPAGSVVRNGNDEDDDLGRDVWIEVPGGDPISLSVRVHGVGYRAWDFSIRYRIEGRPAEFYKLRDDNRPCSDWYLQVWLLEPPHEIEYAVALTKGMKDRRLFAPEREHEWSAEKAAPGSVASFKTIEVQKLIAEGCIHRCRVHTFTPFRDERLNADLGIKLLSV